MRTRCCSVLVYGFCRVCFCFAFVRVDGGRIQFVHHPLFYPLFLPSSKLHKIGGVCFLHNSCFFFSPVL
uniref:Putative secreted protein n=1 Tax=Anopheles darlingi TaxID=43151 RepID=A0A2M4D5H7_ANODA